MSEIKKVTTASKTEKDIDSRRKKRIQNVKAGGDLMMYIGSAGLLIPMIRKAKENQNSLMGICATGAGAILSVGLGNMASKIFNKTVDKVSDFWEDVKPNGPYIKKPQQAEEEEEEDNG